MPDGYPEIPPEIEPFLKYSRQVAMAIVKNQSMVKLMKGVFRKEAAQHPEVLVTLKALTFEMIVDALRPYLNHPEHGIPVKVVIDGGREWVDWHLRELKGEFL